MNSAHYQQRNNLRFTFGACLGFIYLIQALSNIETIKATLFVFLVKSIIYIIALALFTLYSKKWDFTIAWLMLWIFQGLSSEILFPNGEITNRIILDMPMAIFYAWLGIIFWKIADNLHEFTVRKINHALIMAICGFFLSASLFIYIDGQSFFNLEYVQKIILVASIGAGIGFSTGFILNNLKGFIEIDCALCHQSNKIPQNTKIAMCKNCYSPIEVNNETSFSDQIPKSNSSYIATTLFFIKLLLLEFIVQTFTCSFVGGIVGIVQGIVSFTIEWNLLLVRIKDGMYLGSAIGLIIGMQLGIVIATIRTILRNINQVSETEKVQNQKRVEKLRSLLAKYHGKTGAILTTATLSFLTILSYALYDTNVTTIRGNVSFLGSIDEQSILIEKNYNDIYKLHLRSGKTKRILKKYLSYSQAFVRNHSLILVGGEKITVYDISSEKILYELPHDNEKNPKVDISQNGKVLAKFSQSKSTIDFLNLIDGTHISSLPKLDLKDDFISNIFLSSDGEQIAIFFQNGIALWNIQGELLGKVEGYFSSGVFSPSKNRFIAGKGNGNFLILNPKTKEKPTHINIFDHQAVNMIFSPDGKTLVSANYDSTITLWRSNNYQLQETLGHKRQSTRLILLRGHISIPNKLAFWEGNNILISQGWENIKFWRIK